jgi:transposase
MGKVYFVGLDIAKNIFQVFLADHKGRELGNRKLTRKQLIPFFANLSPCTVGIEACGTAHHWARTLIELGHEAKLIQPIRVKAFLGHRNKTDAADARAICEALTHPGTRFVTIKTVAQQEIKHFLSRRERLVRNRTELINQTRSFLSECGIILPKSRSKFEQNFTTTMSAHWDEFSDDFKRILEDNYSEYLDLQNKIMAMDRHIKNIAKDNEHCCRIQEINGMGPLTATALISNVGDAKQFKNGRQMAAYLGLTPREYSSGGKHHLYGITKRGNRQVRTLLVLAAHAAILGIMRRKVDDSGHSLHLSSLDRWILGLKEKIGMFKATVALANKMARIAWVILAKNEHFNPAKAVALEAAK